LEVDCSPELIVELDLGIAILGYWADSGPELLAEADLEITVLG
jgi:hypothetical protein